MMNRKRLIFLFVVISIMLVFVSCLPSQDIMEEEEYVEIEAAYFLIQSSGSDYSVRMFVGRNNQAGVINYGIAGEAPDRYLYVEYDITSTDWYLLETRLATATTQLGLPRTSGHRLDPSSYPSEFTRTFSRASKTNISRYEIPIGDLEGTIWFATYAFAERQRGRFSYSRAWHGPCDYEVPIPPVEQKEALPILDITVDGTVTGFPSDSYGWLLSKTVDPDSFTFFAGTPATEVAFYTLTATRTGPTQDATTSRIDVNVEVTNNSTATTALLDYVKVKLQGYSGSWSDIEEKTLASNVLLAKSPAFDNSKDYTYFFDFDPSGYSKFRVLADTMDTTTASLPVSASATSNEMTVVGETANATATVEDDMGSIVPPGSEVTVESGYSGPWTTDGSWSVTYPATLTFNGQGTIGSYDLPNTATLTSGLFSISDDATVTISIIAGQVDAPLLEATPTLEVVWLRELEYLWDIEKDASPTPIELAKGQSKDIEYTIQVTRTTGPSTDTYTASGTVFVQNVGTAPALDVNTKVQLQGAASDAGPFGDIGSEVDLGAVPGGNLGAGDSHTFNFSFDFTPPSTATHFRIKADITSSAPAMTRYSNTFGPVAPVETTIDATATVTDKLNPPDGFTADYVLSPFDWVISDSTSTTYDVSVTNNDKDSGTHHLTNTATLTTSDRGIKHTDEAIVEITVPHDEECVTETAWGYGIPLVSSNNPWGWYFAYELGADEMVTGLWAGAGQNDLSKGTLVGSVRVWGDGDKLYVKYTLFAPWTMSEAHVYADLASEGVPGTVPGLYPFKDDSLNYVDEYGFEIPYEGEIGGKKIVWSDGNVLHIAAHAVVWSCIPESSSSSGTIFGAMPE